jgi:asparagine synthase (glutamine-hydrolysing)
MCGIAGWLGTFGRPVDSDDVLAALNHRGPDDSGSMLWPSEAGLLHTRLRIIDLSAAGAQPMANEDGSVWVVFNGEIYNHRELQRELEAHGHVFRGRSDTEVIPHLYEEEGDALFRRLRGMFAIAILDLRRRRLLLGRDRFGIKPLFYAPTGRAVAFASELNALRLFPGLDLSPDRQAISDYASVLYVPAPRTVFRGLRALEPGTFADASIGADGDVDVRVVRYHSWPATIARDLTFG